MTAVARDLLLGGSARDAVGCGAQASFLASSFQLSGLLGSPWQLGVTNLAISSFEFLTFAFFLIFVT
jgi:hypothetical protein